MSSKLEEAPSISLFFPVYKDERTVERVAMKALEVLPQLTNDYEVIIVNDGSPDSAGEIAEEIASKHERVRVVHHERNLGYGAALRSGFAASTNEWVCFTDGDDEYEISDLVKLWRLRDYYDLVITFRYVKLYGTWRTFVSYIYNRVLRLLFKTDFRDVSCGLKLIRRDVVNELALQSTSPFIGAEISIKTHLKGLRVGEVGIQTFPRQFGRGSSTSLKNIAATVSDMSSVHGAVFSPNYDSVRSRDS